jgi:hypothetical protein
VNGLEGEEVIYVLRVIYFSRDVGCIREVLELGKAGNSLVGIGRDAVSGRKGRYLSISFLVLLICMGLVFGISVGGNAGGSGGRSIRIGGEGK